MATSEDSKKRMFAGSPVEHREGLRKVARVGSGSMICPICDLTLRPGQVEQHYHLELAKLSGPTPSLAHSKMKRRSSGSAAAKEGNSRERKLFQHTQKVLESVKRRQILFTQQPVPSSSTQLPLDPGASSSTVSPPCCPVCSSPLPAEGALAEAHVNDCLGREEEEGAGSSSDSESFDEYTWCDVTRVRATSMLTPEARANMFGGTVISNVDTNVDDEVDVEDDETALYGPPQYNESHVQHSMESFGREEEEGKDSPNKGSGDLVNSSSSQKHQQHCLICMDHYQNPVVSVKCWHVYCERCWLQALGSKKLCPKCKDITSTSHLRKIFL